MPKIKKNIIYIFFNFLLANLFLFVFFDCAKQNPLSPQPKIYTFYQTWGKDYYTSHGIGPGHGDGTSGSYIGSYNLPLKICSYGNNLFVLDKNNERIQKFSLSGVPADFQNQTESYIKASSLGEKGTTTGKFLNPSDLKIDNFGRLYVADSENFNVQVFDSCGTNITILGTSTYSNGPGGFVSPSLLAIDENNNLYVLDKGKSTIDKYTNFQYSSSFHGDFSQAVDFEYYQDFLYLLFPNKILKLSTSGSIVEEFKLSGFQLEQISQAKGFYINSNGFYICDGNYIKLFDFQFNLVTYWGGISGKRPGEFHSPSDIIEVGNFVYITDSENNRIQVYKKNDS